MKYIQFYWRKREVNNFRKPIINAICIRLQGDLIHSLFHKTGVAYSDIFLKLPIKVKLKHRNSVFLQRIVSIVW